MTPVQSNTLSPEAQREQLRVVMAIEHSPVTPDWSALLTDWEQRQPADRGPVVVVEEGPSGIVLGFSQADAAVDAALHVARACPQTLRMGAHLGDDAEHPSRKAFAQHLARHAEAGEFLGSESLREHLVPGLDAEVEEVVEGIPSSPGTESRQRAFRIRACGAAAAWPSFAEQRPTLVMLPLRVEAGNACDPVYAELIHYGASRALAQNKAWHLISSLSSAPYRHRSGTPADLKQRLRASHVLSGTVGSVGRQLHTDLSLTDCHSGALLWQERISLPSVMARSPDNPFGRAIAHGVSMCIFGQPGETAGLVDLAEIESYRLLFDAMALMHSAMPAKVERAREALTLLARRHPQASEPHAWLAKWHVMDVARRRSASVHGSTLAAQAAARCALAGTGDRALALTIAGHVDAYLTRDFAAAESQLQEALAANPNESLAWLYLSALYVYQDRPTQAADAALMAQLLSPLDPLRYYYDNFAAHALLAADRVPEALVMAQRSLSANPHHLLTWLVLIMGRALNQQIGQANLLARQLLQLDPAFSVEKFLKSYPGAASAQGQRFADALRAAGLPER